MWESSLSSVTGAFAVRSFAGTFQPLRYVLMSPSSESLPSCDEHERAHRGDRLADRARLEERRRRDGLLRLDVGEAVPLRPLELRIPDHGDADARDAVEAHPLLERPGLVALDQDRRTQAVLDLRDACRPARARLGAAGEALPRRKQGTAALGPRWNLHSSSTTRSARILPKEAVAGSRAAGAAAAPTVEPKVTTGAWSLVPTSARTTDRARRLASASLARR